MAKGKAAAQNANRRATEATERANALAAELTREKRERAAEAADLTGQIRRLRGEMDRLIDERAAERVGQARQAAAEEIETMRAEYGSNIDKAMRAMFRRREELHPDLIEQVAQALGYNTSQTHGEEMLQRRPDMNNRKVRRVIDRRSSSFMARMNEENNRDPLIKIAERMHELHGPRGAEDSDDASNPQTSTE